MNNADDGLTARLRLEEAAIEQALAGRLISRRFTEPRVIFVLIDDYGDYLLTCDSLIDRNAQLRARGVNIERDRWACAYWNPAEGRFIVSGNDQQVAERLKKQLKLY